MSRYQWGLAGSDEATAERGLPKAAKPDALAAFVMAITHGMVVQAKAGFSRDMLEAVAEQALSAWPAGRSTRAAKSSRNLR